MNKSVFVLSIILTIFFCNLLFAHKINLYAYAEGKKVFIRGYFREGSPAKNASIEVFTSDGKKALDLKTDEKGECFFEAPFRTDFLIKIDTGDGHSAEYLLKSSELPSDLPPYKGTFFSEIAKQTTNEQLQNPPKTETALSLSEERLRAIVEEAVERKIAPLRKMVLEIEAKEGAVFEKILAGIGIIWGFFGFYLFLRMKIKKEK